MLREKQTYERCRLRRTVGAPDCARLANGIGGGWAPADGEAPGGNERIDGPEVKAGGIGRGEGACASERKALYIAEASPERYGGGGARYA